mmetsp:Transcript_28943/g.66991  ORF Transcript_28943/g.66991 Transcript_28943/m.66991 type:complete len:219 (-) Transcript_28943:2504-3160(-)
MIAVKCDLFSIARDLELDDPRYTAPKSTSSVLTSTSGTSTSAVMATRMFLPPRTTTTAVPSTLPLADGRSVSCKSCDPPAVMEPLLGVMVGRPGGTSVVKTASMLPMFLSGRRRRLTEPAATVPKSMDLTLVESLPSSTSPIHLRTMSSPPTIASRRFSSFLVWLQGMYVNLTSSLPRGSTVPLAGMGVKDSNLAPAGWNKNSARLLPGLKRVTTSVM